MLLWRGSGSNCSVLTNLSHQYISTQHGNTGYQYGTVSSQHGTASGAYSIQDGGGVPGYFSSEGDQPAGNGSLPGINNVHILTFDVTQSIPVIFIYFCYFLIVVVFAQTYKAVSGLLYADCRDHSFLHNAEFWAEPRNLPISAEFLCFYRILQNSALAGDVGDKSNTAYFGGVQAAVLYVYTISPWNTWLPLGLWWEE